MVNFGNNGTNPQAYLGVLATTPPQLLYMKRAPTSNDWQNLRIGTFWFYTNYPRTPKIYELWQLADLTGNQAVWIPIYPVSGSGLEFVTDNGTAEPLLGILNVKQATANQGTPTFQAPGSSNLIDMIFTDSNSNTGIGLNSQAARSGSVFNTSVGVNSLLSNITSVQSCAFGVNALKLSTGSSNSAFGAQTLSTLTGGGSTGNCAFGINSLNALASGQGASAFGAYTLQKATALNDAFGYGSLSNTTSGAGNCSFGYESAQTNITGNNLNAFGYQTLNAATAGPNDAFGTQSQLVTTSGTNNCSFGTISMAANTTGSSNCAMGVQSLWKNSSGSASTAIGYQALKATTTSSNSTAIGYQSQLSMNSAGGINDSFGSQSLYAATSGGGNLALGAASLAALATGSFNTCVGLACGANYTGSESWNLIIGNGVQGTTGESGAIRIGSFGNNTTCFVQGINGVNVGSTAKVATVATTGQLGTATITAGGGISVTTGANTITIATSGSGGGFVGFSTYVSTTYNPVNYGSPLSGYAAQGIVFDTILFDTTGGIQLATGTFKAQVAGYYEFKSTIFCITSAYGDYVGCALTRTPSGGGLAETYNGDQSPTTTSANAYSDIGWLTQVSVSKILYCNVNDYVQAIMYRYLVTGSNDYTGFQVAGSNFSYSNFPVTGTPMGSTVYYTTFQGQLLQ